MIMTATAISPRDLVWDHIESCLDVNSSWREMFNACGIIATVDFDDWLDESDYLVNDVAEELDLTAQQVISAWRDYVIEHRLWTPDMVASEYGMQAALEYLKDMASPREIVAALSDWAVHEKRPDILMALNKCVLEMEENDQDEWLEVL